MMSEENSLLVVDDIEDNLTILSFRLKQKGYVVATATSGRKALEMIGQQKFDLILLDIMMPEMDGFDVLVELRKKYSITDLPVIMATAKEDREDIVRALKLGANDYITKPVDFPVLMARIQTHLKIKSLSQLKDEFLRIASHDLKNPLWSIMTAAQLIDEVVPAGQQMTPQASRMLNLVLRQAQTMQFIINDFLDFQAAEDGQLNLNLGMTDLNEIACRAVETNLSYAQQKGSQLILEADPALPMILADSARLSQVIQNLIGNAIKFSPKGSGQTVVRTRIDQKTVVLEVSDSGPGLTEDDMQRVFTRYGRLSNRPTGGEKSSGLGLAICKKMVELHSGQIGVFNNPDRGATFWFSLPMPA
ncbi:MAG TPA: response regulator [Chloroflexia bacterium]|nr:response regulator [Chloroflexia bacterium]